MSAVARDIERASEAVRAANHSTMRGVLDGPESYDAVGNLVELVHRLPQVLDFLARSLRRADPAEHYDDRGADPATALGWPSTTSRTPRDHIAVVARRLDSAHNHLGHIGRHATEED